jgi:2-keto-4-pentenoate hydratase/2-oxohepta-3-ene-1,7-dioic acid hydratase in catechol pathway
MKLAQYLIEGEPCIGVQVGTRWMNYTLANSLYYLVTRGELRATPRTIAELVEQGKLSVTDLAAVVAFVRSGRLERLTTIPRTAVLRAPLERPRKIVALGLNYVLHAREGNFQVPKEPILFLKAGSSVIGPGEPIRLPQGMGRMDHEVELAVVIGRRASGVKKRDAAGVIAGYTVINDVTARDLQTSDLAVQHPWFRSKSFDTFTPMGPWMVTADEIPLPVRLAVECRVNGKVRQKSTTANLVFDLPTIIEYVSRHITLEPGDVISTGTPEGIGPLVHGDVVSCRIAKIGELRNPVKNR